MSNIFNINKKTIVFIEPYGAAISLLRRGAELGHNIVILTENSDMRVISRDVLLLAALAIQVDTSNDDAVMDVCCRLHKAFEISAVIPGFEYFVPIAAKVAALLGLPGIGYEYALNLRRKDTMRSLTKAAGLAAPEYYLVTSMSDIESAAQKIGFPLICKPVDAAGSVHVRLSNNMDELIDAASNILSRNNTLWGYQLTKSLLLEEYIDGKEYSIEGVIQNGKVVYFSCTEKFVHDQRDFIEIGHIANVPIDPKLKYTIQEYVSNVISALHANNCPFHAEIRLRSDGIPVLMEIAARLAGDKIAELINLSRGVNYFDHVLATYLGDPLPIDTMNDLFAGVRFFYRPEVDCYHTVNGIDSLSDYQIEDISFYYQPDHAIPSFPKPLRRLGHVIVKSTDYNNLLQTLRHVDAVIQFS